jgi:hypothetical protein
MSEMIERVSEALSEAYRREGMAGLYRGDIDVLARAAIKAMRPIEIESPLWETIEEAMFYEVGVSELWERVIDTMLEDKKTEP